MKFLPTAVLLLLSVALRANNYYFSSQSGDDTRTSAQAQNQLTPWKTLTKLNSFFSNLLPGDSVLFKRGETFYGFIISAASGTASSPITFAAYGTGEKPVISGFSVLNNWVSAGGNTWQTINPSLTDSVAVLTLNGISQFRGRYPNANAANGGYLTYESHTGNSQITDNELGSSQNWTGADIVIRKNRFIIDRGSITQQTGNTISYTGTSSYDGTDNFGYFIQNHPATLDQRGEWCYDKTARKITLYLDAEENPNSQLILASSIKTIWQAWGVNYIHITDLDLEGANENGVDLSSTTAIQISNCILKNSGQAAVKGVNNTSLLVDNCQILNSSNNGFKLYDFTGSTISNSTIKNTGVFAGMGQNGNDNYQAILITGPSNTISNNIVDSTGYIAIHFQGDFDAVKNNLVQNFNFVKDDGGGIYTWTGSPNTVYTGRSITDNIVLNGIGAGYGTNSLTDKYTVGIYIDEAAGFIDILRNSVAFCQGAGLYLHNANNINARNNTIFNNNWQMLFHEDHGYPITQNSIFSNILFSKYSTQPIANYISGSEDMTGYGAFDSNYYCRPIDDKFIIETNYAIAGASAAGIYDLAGWQAKFGLDLNSKITGTQIPPYTIANLSATNIFPNGSFNTNIDSALTASSGNIIHNTWTTGEKLDGGAMKVYFDGPNDAATNSQVSYVIMRSGAVDTTKQYLLRFSLQGTKNQKSFKVYLRKEGDPYNQLVPAQYCNMSTSRTENEFLFSFPQSQNRASIVFETTKDAGDFYVDNVRLSEVTLTPTNADDYIRFEYNASGSSRTVDLNSTQYVDAKNNLFNGTVTLAPWSSIVLIKTSLNVLPVKFSKFTGKLVNNEVQLNWSTTPPPQGSHFEIERSPDVSFTKIGTASADPTIADYRFTDPSPAAGKNYYRIKEVDADGVATYSSIILININTAGKTTLWPNPATDRINITVPQSMVGKTITLRLQTVAGVVLVKKQLTVSSSSLPVDISAYSRGVYLLSISENLNGQSATFSFIKQ